MTQLRPIAVIAPALLVAGAAGGAPPSVDFAPPPAPNAPPALVTPDGARNRRPSSPNTSESLAGAATATCVAGPSPHELRAWSEFLAGVLCDAVRSKGLGGGVPGAVYAVTVDRLGASYSLLVTYEQPAGTTRRMLWAPLHDMRESKGVLGRFA